MAMLTDGVLETFGLTAAGGLAGAAGFWIFTKLNDWWMRPVITIDYGKDYPFRDRALFSDGTEGEYLRVRVKNGGRSTARRAKCYVRHIRLYGLPTATFLPSEELMLTSWVPRERGATIMNIPSGLDFLADLVRTRATGAEGPPGRIEPMFNTLNRNLAMVDHVGEFEFEVVVVGENFPTATRTIRFLFDGNSLDLLPLP